ncbi:MAG: O-antigen ligase family protein [Ignavibacteriaceae bacterium]|nr:O-antigen ligase family protein [Ignavibacteriaceae bacterium]
MHSDDLYNGLITAKQLWFYGSVSVLFIVTSIVILVKRITSLRINLVDLSVLFFYLYFFVRSLTTSYTPILHNQKFLNWTILVIMYFIIRFTLAGSSTGNEKTENKSCTLVNNQLIRFIIWIILLTGLVEAIWGLLQLYGFRQSFNSNFKITGSFFNPAPYALYLAAVFPMALGVWLNSSGLRAQSAGEESSSGRRAQSAGEESSLGLRARFRGLTLTPGIFIMVLARYLSLITLLAIILVLPATMIRASWLGIVAGSAVALNYRYGLLRKAGAMLTSPARKVFVIACAILITALSVTGLYYLKKGSSTGKLLIWEVTLGKIVEKPLFGHGTGRFEAEYNNWQAEYFKSHTEEMDGPKGMAAGNTKYCFNEYLEMASELGLIGLLLFLAVIASICFGINTGANDNRMTREALMTINDGRRPNDAKQMTPAGQMTFSILIPSLVSLLVMALISFPFYTLPTLIIFFLLLSIISSRVKEISAKNLIGPSVLRGLIKAAAFFILLPVSVLLFFMARQQYKAYYAFDESVMLYQIGSYEESCGSFSEVYKHMKYNGPYLQYYGKALLLAGRYEESIAMYERAKNYTGDEMLYCSLGDACKALKRYKEAEEAYLHASYMVPHKLYPLYLLAILYEETEQEEKAVAVAKKVLNKKVKVESEATEEIKATVKKIFQKYQTKTITSK